MSKEKIYCGCGKIPSGYKKGSMSECVEMGQVRLYGLYKINPKLLEKTKTKEKEKFLTEKELTSNIAKLRGVKIKLERELKGEKDSNKKKLIETKIAENTVELKKIAELYKKVNSGEKIKSLKSAKKIPSKSSKSSKKSSKSSKKTS
jgi:hypothetical protein